MAISAKYLKASKQVVSALNKGVVDSGLDKNVELLEIEALHTKTGDAPLIIIIEPANLSIDNDVRIQMSEGSTNFYGRAEGMPSYASTRRSIDIGFMMIKSEVLNGSEAVTNNTVTANLLQQVLYPAYMDTGTQNTSVIKTPPFFRVKYGDLIGDFKGNQRVGGWRGEIGENLGYGMNLVKIPISYRVQLNFNVLHEHVVGWYDGKFGGNGNINWPINTGIPGMSSYGAPGKAAENPGAGEKKAVPGTPSAVVGKCVTDPKNQGKGSI